RDIRRNW
ncbi:unnamed protein product, partial [Allacma fusca]